MNDDSHRDHRPHATTRSSTPRCIVNAVRTRFANRPDSEHGQAFVRLIVVGLIVVYFLVQATMPIGAPANYNALLAYGGAYIVFSIGFLAWIAARPGISPLRRILGMIGDHSSTSLLIACCGPWGGALYPVYLWVTFGNGFRFGNIYLAAATAYSTLAFIIASLLHPFWFNNPALTIGMILGLVALPAYVSHLIRLLQDAKRAADAANIAKSRFLATMSHELRTPLNSVIGFSDVLTSTNLTDDQVDCVHNINKSGKILLSLINDILDLAKIEAGRIEIKNADFDLAAEIGETIDVLRRQADKKNIGLAVVADSRVPVRAHGDASHLRQILMNLLSNAIKFTENGGVTLRIRRHDNGALIFEVDDTGPGIDSEHQTRIFDAFTQADEGDNRRHEGTGLGLAIARQLATAMGGQLELVASSPEGSRFRLTIPFITPETVGPMPQGCLVHPVTRDDDNDIVPLILRRAGLNKDTNSRTPILLTLDDLESAEAAPPDDLETHMRTANGGIILRDQDPPARWCWPLGTVVLARRPNDPDDVAAARTLLEGLITPDRDDSSNTAETPAANESAPSNATGTILLVEDNDMNRCVQARILEREGHRVAGAQNGDEALDALEQDSYDLVFMDVNMPGESGVEVAKFFRYMELGADRTTPIIALTADVTTQTEQACREAGMDDHLTKPVRKADLVDVARRWIATNHSATAS